MPETQNHLLVSPVTAEIFADNRLFFVVHKMIIPLFEIKRTLQFEFEAAQKDRRSGVEAIPAVF